MLAYEYISDQLAVSVNVVCDELRLVKPATLRKQVERGKVIKLQNGGGKNRHAMIAFESLTDDIQIAIKDAYGEPPAPPHLISFEKLVGKCQLPEARDFFQNHIKPNGKHLSPQKQDVYINNSRILKTALSWVNERVAFRKKKGGRVNEGQIWQACADEILTIEQKRLPFKLPNNARKLKQKAMEFQKKGFESLMHKGEGNSNSLKISNEVADALIAMYSLPVKYDVTYVTNWYNQEAQKNNWVQLSESGVRNFLFRPDIEPKWYASRHGKKEYENKFGYKFKRDKQRLFPNAWWAIDGSKLDWLHFQDNTLGIAGKLKIDPVFDVYSEKIIGWSYSESETHIDHYKAMKMAMQTALVRPLLITYDNQSGHKTKKTQGLYNRLIATNGTHYPHQARRSSSPVEQLLMRFQKQVNRQWFSDKQSVRSKRLDNQPNMEFVLANKDYLPTKDELLKTWKQEVQNWNNAKHPTLNCTRNEAYQHEQKIKQEVDFFEAMSCFFLRQTKVKSTNYSIRIRVQKQNYDFEVYGTETDGNGNRLPDFEFLAKYPARSEFVVKYDPEMLDEFVELYQYNEDGEEEFVAYAEPKQAFMEIPQLQNEGEKAYYKAIEKAREKAFEANQAEIKAIQQRAGIRTEDLVNKSTSHKKNKQKNTDSDVETIIKMGGHATKEDRGKVEANASIYDLLT